jgi:serine/threonine-protein kinase RsbW
MVTYHATDVPRTSCRKERRKVLLVNDPPGSGRLGADEVEVRMPARTNHLPSIRAMAADLAMRADFDLDSISDLRLAVEEACGTVLANSGPDGELVCRLLVSPARVRISAHVPLPSGRKPAVTALSLRILRALSDSVDCWTSSTNGYRLLHVQLTKAPLVSVGDRQARA